MPYKRHKFLFVVAVLISAAARAQPEGEIIAPLQQQNINTDEELKTKLGIKFTMGGHTFRGDAFDNEKLLYGFGAGIYNVIKLNKERSLNFHWELDFTFKGSKFGKLNDTSFSKISLSYVEVPVYLSIRLFNTQKKQPMHLLLGAQLGYLFRSSLNKAYGKFGEVKTELPFKRLDLYEVVGFRKELGSGMSVQLCAKVGLINIYTQTFQDRVLNPDLSNTNRDYRDITPTFKDGTHQAKNLSFELSFLF